jgi:hypothetical protein
MTDTSTSVQTLYSSSGERVGIYIPAELWSEVESDVLPYLQAALEKLTKPPAKPEPLKDWDLLAVNWDFGYPLDMHVHCSQCGNTTLNWQQDEPRKFRLKAASLGGLVAFECCSCKARVTKRHFKDGVTMETSPWQKK